MSVSLFTTSNLLENIFDFIKKAIDLLPKDDIIIEIHFEGDYMKLILPSIKYKSAAIDYIEEFNDFGSAINGSGALDRFLEESTYEMWLEKISDDMDIYNIPDGKVPALTYFYYRESDAKIVGMINLRLALNDFLRTEGGHIGYSIRPTERNKHYATNMLKESLKVYKKLGIPRVILTCDSTNPASQKVIENCDGIFEASFFSNSFGCNILRYSITTDIK